MSNKEKARQWWTVSTKGGRDRGICSGRVLHDPGTLHALTIRRTISPPWRGQTSGSDTSVTSDVRMRAMGFYRAAQALVSRHDPETVSMLEAHCAGVNDCISSHRVNLLYLFDHLVVDNKLGHTIGMPDPLSWFDLAPPTDDQHRHLDLMPQFIRR